MNKIKVYVGSDGKLHFTNASGADTALNFKNSVYENIQLTKYVQVDKTYTLKKGQIIIITSQGVNFDDPTKQPKLNDTSNMRMFANGHSGYWLTIGVATADKTISLSLLHNLNDVGVEIWVS
jgi:hypothetical protein